VARSTQKCLEIGVPLVASIVGEGGSGGAVAVATANRIIMFEHAIYAVISPEGCASILWRTADKAADAAEAMKLTAQDLRRLGVIDTIVDEPLGGAHRAPADAIARLGDAVAAELRALEGLDSRQLRADRRAKFLEMGRAA
jgi:acetyl-CoA carboxylase carboxyl transferase subunit alpha